MAKTKLELTSIGKDQRPEIGAADPDRGQGAVLSREAAGER